MISLELSVNSEVVNNLATFWLCLSRTFCLKSDQLHGGSYGGSYAAKRSKMTHLCDGCC